VDFNLDAIFQAGLEPTQFVEVTVNPLGRLKARATMVPSLPGGSGEDSGERTSSEDGYEVVDTSEYNYRNAMVDNPMARNHASRQTTNLADSAVSNGQQQPSCIGISFETADTCHLQREMNVTNPAVAASYSTIEGQHKTYADGDYEMPFQGSSYT
jgi:hypothetical protein